MLCESVADKSDHRMVGEQARDQPPVQQWIIENLNFYVAFDQIFDLTNDISKRGRRCLNQYPHSIQLISLFFSKSTNHIAISRRTVRISAYGHILSIALDH